MTGSTLSVVLLRTVLGGGGGRDCWWKEQAGAPALVSSSRMILWMISLPLLLPLPPPPGNLTGEEEHARGRLQVGSGMEQNVGLKFTFQLARLPGADEVEVVLAGAEQDENEVTE